VKAVRLHDIYTASFPFLDSAEYKLRPVIVVSLPYGEHGILAVVPLSSRARPESVDFAISNWREAGLAKPSTARVHRVATILQSKLASRLGSLKEDDVDKLQQSIRSFLGL